MDHHDALLKKYAECLNTHTFSSDECFPVVKAEKESINAPDVVNGIKYIEHNFAQKMMQGEKNE